MYKSFWSSLQTFCNGVAVIVLSVFILIVSLLRPVWGEIDSYLGLGIGIIKPALFITALALLWLFWLLLWEIIWKSPFASSWSIAVAILMIAVWSITLHVLVHQTSNFLTSIQPPSSLYLFVSLLLVGFALVFSVLFTRFKSKAAVFLSLVCIIASVYGGIQSITNATSEHNRWEQMAKLDYSDWKASWITPPMDLFQTESPPNSWWLFRKSFEIKNIPGSASTRIATDTHYWLWVNNILVIRQGGLKRGPTPFDTYYDAVDLAPYLVKGKNTIAIQVWHLGRDGFSHHDSGKAGLLFDLQTPGLTVVSDGSWKVKKNTAFYQTNDPNPNYRLAESNIGYDARNDPTGWANVEFDTSTWQDVKVAGPPPAAPWNNLVQRPIPFWDDSELGEYKAVEIEQNNDGSQTVTAQLPYNIQFYPYIQVKSQAGLKIRMQTDTYENGGANSLRAEYITREGEQEFESLGWLNGDKVLYTLPKGVELISVKYRQTGYASVQTGSFLADDLFLNQLYQKSFRSLSVNMRDTFMDCPNRERAQWWGDVMVELQQAGYALDADSLLLARKGILELAAWQKTDGVLFSPIPSGNWDKELPVQMLQAVYGTKQYYLLTGDIDTVQTVYPAIKGYMDLWQMGANGLVIHRDGGWNWVDWGEKIDQPVLENAWYYLALQSQLDLAEASGKTQDIPGIEQKMGRLHQSFNTQFWNGSGYRSAEYTGTNDDRVQAMAVITGLASKEKYPHILKIFQQELHASPMMENFVSEAMMQMGYDQAALERMKTRYKDQVESEHTTLWEGWELAPDKTFNHAWGAGSLYLLPGYVAGIRPTEPGFRVFEVVPHMGNLGRVGATVPTPRGLIEVHIRKSTSEYNLQVNVPKGSQGWIGILESDLKKYPNLQTTRDGESVEVQPGIHDGAHAYYQVQSGQWEFSFHP